MTHNRPVYAQGTPLVNVLPLPITDTGRDPTSSDIGYPIGQQWMNGDNIFELQAVAAGAARWIVLGGGATAVLTLSGDSGTANPSAGNIQIKGTPQQIVTVASGNQVQVEFPTNVTIAGSLVVGNGSLLINSGNFPTTLLESGSLGPILTSTSAAADITIIPTGGSLTSPPQIFAMGAMTGNYYTMVNVPGNTFTLSNTGYGNFYLFTFSGTVTVTISNSAALNLGAKWRCACNSGTTVNFVLAGGSDTLLGNSTLGPTFSCEIVLRSVLPGQFEVEPLLSATGGNVVGPGSATNFALAAYSGTTGKIIQNSALITNSNGDLIFGGVGGNVAGSISTNNTQITIQSTTTNADVVLQASGAGVVVVNDELDVLSICNLNGGWFVPQNATLNVAPWTAPADNASIGIGTLSNSIATIATGNITANSRVFAMPATLSGTTGWLSVDPTSYVVGTSFTVVSSGVNDNSTFFWIIFN